MDACPACGATTVAGRFCGTCGQLLRPGSRPRDASPAVSPLDDPPREPRITWPDREPEPYGGAERPDTGAARWTLRSVLAGVAIAAVAIGAFVGLQPEPEVVSAGRWRGDGTGTTSTRSADAQQVLWSNRRVGVSSFDLFREEPVTPLGSHDGLLVVATGGYVVAVDAATGTVRWERYVGHAAPVLVEGQLLAPAGPGIASWDATTGEETGWFGTGGDVPPRIAAAGPELVVVAGAASDDTLTSEYRGYRRDGSEVFRARAVHHHAWRTTTGPRLVLVDPRAQTLVQVAMDTGERSAPIGPVVGILDAADGWVLVEAPTGASLVWLDGGRSIRVPREVVAVPSALQADGDAAIVIGRAPSFRPPPRGNDVAVRVNGRTGRLTPWNLEPGFGEVVGSRPRGVLTRSGSLVRLVDVGPLGAIVRWEEGIDPTAPAQVVGELVGQFEPGRLRAWNADTGMLVFDVVPGGLPGPDRRAEVRTQPYLRADGFVLDVADTLTQVIDPIDGERVDIRGSVHVVATEAGDLVRGRDSIALIGVDGVTRWEVTVAGGVQPAGIELFGDVIAVVDQPTGSTISMRTIALADGAPLGSTDVPMAWSNQLFRVTDAAVLVGDGVEVIDVTTDGPVRRWHASVDVDPDATPIVVGDALALVGRSTVTRLDLRTGDAIGTDRLPRIVHPVVAYDGDVVIATSGAQVVAIDLGSLEERWATATGSRITTSPTLAGGRVYVGTEDGAIVSLSMDGEVADRLETGFAGPVVGAPTVAHGLLYVLADRGRQLVALGTP